MWFLVSLLSLAWLALPVWALVVALRAEREALQLRERVRQLEAERGAALAAVPAPREPGAEPQPPPPIPFPAPVAPMPIAPPPPPGTPAVATGTPRAFFDQAQAEEMVGGLWLQNVGAVLVLVGAFFSIVWGYTTGRLGPGILVIAGVLLGLALVWRGDRLARTLTPIGHALIGIGLGVVYLAIYLGWFTLHVLPSAAALPLLAVVALGSVAVGLRYRSQGVAALGVIGAFVPQVMASVLHLRGFDLGAPELLAYLALVDVVVFVLAARAGWSLLDLMALVLTTVTWFATFPQGDWGWALQIGLALLYSGAALAPVARLARDPEPARPATLAVIVTAPLMFALVSWPFIEYVGRSRAAMLLIALAAVYVAAAWWIDSRRERDDAWRPLAAAATLFVTLALERWAGSSYVSLAWLAEGAVLVWLGAGRRGAWLRGCGAVVSFLGALAHLFALLDRSGDAMALPFVDAHGLRMLGGLVLLLLTGALLGREERFRGEWRRLLSRGWVTAAMVMLLIYSATESDHLARALEGTGGRWARPPELGVPPAAQRVGMLRAFLTSALWTLQAAALVAVGWGGRSSFLRWLGLGLLGLTVLKFVLGDLAQVDVFWRFVSAVLVGVALLAVSYFYQRRMRRERG